jgi:hypothetical protein
MLHTQVADAATISFKRLGTFGKRHLLTARAFSDVATQVRQHASERPMLPFNLSIT